MNATPKSFVPAAANRLALAALLTLGAGLAALPRAHAAAASAAAVVVPTLAVQAAPVGAGFELDGVVQPVRQATVAAQVPGNVLALLVKAGDRVKAGQVLARIDARDVQAGLARTQAAVSQAEAEARNARMQLQRTRELRAQGFISQAALDTAETQARAAEAGTQEAQAARSQAALARGFAVVAAPFDAVVLATHVEAGDLAAAGRPIATLYAPQPLRAVVQVPASRAEAARAADRVEVQLPARSSADAKTTTAWVKPSAMSELPNADAVSQTVEWRLELAGATAPTPGQSVRVRFVGSPAAVTAGTPRAITVPAAAVLRRGELSAVYVAQPEGFVLRAVRLGADRGAAGIEVLAGLKPGERLAVDAVRAGLTGARPQVEATAQAELREPAQR